MKKIKIISFFLILYFFLASCNSIKDAANTLKNNKIRSVDEFLVKKNEPLSRPPDWGNMPSPDSKVEKEEQSKLEKIFKIKAQETKNISASSTEELFLKQIK